jgi:fibronectin-binding autotransporter adhesin
MNLSWTSLLKSITAVAALLTANPAQAQTTFYWNGGSISSSPAAGGTGIWNTTNAWRTGSNSGNQGTWAAGTGGTNVGYLAGTAGTITLGTAGSSNFTGTSLTVETSGYTVTSTSGSRNLVMTGALTLGQNVAFTANQNSTGQNWGFGSISGGAGSSLTISGAATANNANRINLSATATSNMPSVMLSGSDAGPTGFVATANGHTLSSNVVNNSATSATMLGATSGNSLNYSGVLSGAAHLQISAGQSGGAGIVTLSGVNTFAGDTYTNNASNAVLRIGIANALPPTTNIFMGSSAGGGTADNGGSIDLNGFDLAVASLTAGVSARGITNNTTTFSTLTIGKASGTHSFGGVIGTVANTNLTMQSNNIALIKTGNSSQILSGSNTYTGGTTINAGTLSISADANLGDAAGGITLGGGTLEMTSSFTLGSGRTILALADTTSTLAVSSGTVSYGGAFTGSGNLDKAGAGWLVVSNASSSYTGLFTISAGTLEVTGSNAFANATLRQTGGELLLAPVGGGEVTIPDLDGSSGTTTVAESVTAVVGGSGNSSYNGQIRGQGGLKKVGNGRLTLTGANDFAGDAVVESGILELAAGGSITAPARASNGGQLKVNGRAGGTVTIDAGGILSGSGTLGGLATIAGTHASGNSPGLQTAEDGLSYNASAVLAWELSANTDSLGDRGVLFDAINVTGGNLSITNGATIDLIFTSPLQNLTASTVVWNDAFWNEDRSWTIIDFTSNGTSTGTFALGTIGLDMNGDSLASVRPNASFSVNNVGGDIVLSYVAVPEPPAVLLGGLGVAAAGWAVRRRRTWLNA